MNLELLITAPLAIQLHLWAAVAAFAIGGTLALIAFIAISSFGIHEIDVWHGFSPIHLISIYVLVMLPLGVWHVRRGNVASGMILSSFRVPQPWARLAGGEAGVRSDLRGNRVRWRSIGQMFG